MPAPLGNQFWKLRSKHGRDMIFSSPTILWEACQEYFEATDKRKWMRIEFHGKDATECKVPNETPYTKSGLYLFLDIDHKTWEVYSQREDFAAICSRVELIIYTQKIEGANVGAFNHSIVALELGLVKKTEITKQKFEVKRKE